MSSSRCVLPFVLGLSLWLGAACESPVPSWDHTGSTHGSADGGADPLGTPIVRFEPATPADAVTSVTRISLAFARPLGAPRVLLLSGVLSPAQLRDFERPLLPATLATRAEPAVIWTAADSRDLVVAPRRRLTPGGAYTVAVSEPLVAVPFVVALDDEAPRLRRVWPDVLDSDASAATAVWCDDAPLADVDQVLTLPPSGWRTRVTRGTGSSVLAPRCLTLRAAAEISAQDTALPAVAPSTIGLDDASLVLLDPVLLWPSGSGREVESLLCATTEVPFGRGCAEVEDDRLLVRTPDAPLLWTIDDGSAVIVRASRAQKTMVLRPMAREGRYRVGTLDLAGGVETYEITVEPGAPRLHVVVNEVMANPLGIERDQEWIELYNDGASATSTAGLTVETAGGAMTLPAATLEPGGYALVVPTGFVEDDGADPVVRSGTTILRVPALGRDGLSNEGERITLRDAKGAVLSVFPAMKAKSGVSNVRVAPEAPDTNADSFAPSATGNASPGAPNTVP